jgi:hypothetical protein
MNDKQSYALGYYYGRYAGSYEYFDIDSLTDSARYEFKIGYDSGVTDYCLFDLEEVA